METKEMNIRLETPKDYREVENLTREAYEATFPQKEKAFQEGQLPQFCQSCGMPLTKHEDCGTNADGSTNYDYCQYCYKDGKFLQECTMDEMIEHCAQFVDEVNKNMPQPMTKEEYKQMMQGFFAMLKRWKYSSPYTPKSIQDQQSRSCKV